jgi:hypothetical protein
VVSGSGHRSTFGRERSFNRHQLIKQERIFPVKRCRWDLS